MLGRVLSALVAVTLVAIGTGAIVAPGKAAAQYGIALDDPRALAFIRAMGVRDLAIGVLFGLLLRADARELLAWSTLAIMPIAAIDFLVVIRDRRATGVFHGLDRPPLLHAAGGLGLLVTAVVLYAGI